MSATLSFSEVLRNRGPPQRIDCSQHSKHNAQANGGRVSNCQLRYEEVVSFRQILYCKISFRTDGTKN